MDLRAPLDILIVTGPLGGGKTTVVNRLLKAEVAAGRRVAVLINEFGAISVDGTLVDAERPELAGVQNLVNGCVCCSLRDDVVATLRAWCDQPEGTRPERVVLETTGLADPTDLLDLEHEPALEGRLRLAGLLTVISCLAPVDHLKTKPLLHRQAALASLIHLSKADLDPSAAVAWEGELLRAKGVCAFRGWARRKNGSDRWAFQLADGRLEISPLPLRADGTTQDCAAVVIGTGLDGTYWKKALRELERPPEGARRRVNL